MRSLLWALIVLIVAIPLFAVAAWEIAVPLELIESGARTPLEAQGLDLAFKGLAKGLFFSLHSDEVTVLRGDMPVISATDAEAALRPLSLLSGRPEAGFKAKLAGGTITGTATLVKRYLYLKADLTGADLASIRGLLEPLGLRGSRGNTSASFDVGPDGGHIEFTVRDAALGTFAGVQTGSVPLGMLKAAGGIPLGIANTAGGTAQGLASAVQGGNIPLGIINAVANAPLGVLNTARDTVLGIFSVGQTGNIPLGMFNTVRGALSLKNGVTEITSLSLEGRDIYAKAAGSISRSGALDLALVVMPSPGSPYASLLGQMPGWTRTGPGRYETRLRTPGRK